MQISWFNKKLETRKSPISGTGVFAKKQIARGETVAVFGGFVVDVDTLKKNKTTCPKEYKTILEIGYQITDNLIYAPTTKAQFSVIEYLNHNCDPNCGFEDAITLVAMRDIPKNTEISMDYAMCVSLKMFEMKCECGSSICRGFVHFNDWKIKELQKKYKKFFQPYIRKKIKLLNVKK
ncbi:hypothetical protein A2592_00810 [Candidatus Kaiserbacteria bacterium RIFOXYD1_FULL_42_15]|uniref:SET domain-containing protein n=1 Tax=Candidatus Kaiserbacteria bacterium RIFOXYD1_FULL_42_15 TaxID=1798532 RepID=A0A1F6FR60_9BACT|nr:MAG: hypothetical protein A2592_00810 [Candidatus Kaiserbacteria bacterium RIFOXYD1_FULL_42_15]